MGTSTFYRMVLATALAGSLAIPAIAAPDATRPPVEAVPAPKPAGSPPVANPGRSHRAFQGPMLSTGPTPVPMAVPLPGQNEHPLPINLATALRLSEARPIMIAAAQASVQVAASQLQRAQVLWLPNLNVGAAYLRHDGGVQGSSGQFFNNERNQFMAGVGPTAIVSTTDAFFAPLAARQVLRSRTFDVQAARNDALLAVAEAYFNVQQARGRLAGADDARNKANFLVKKVNALASGLVSPIEINRASAQLATLQQAVASAEGEWGGASAELTRVLRLDPTAVVVPQEPPHLQISLIALDRGVDELIPVGLTSRPELASQQALVQAALARLREERMRPLMPSLVLLGGAAPTSISGYLSSGVFTSSNNGQGAPVVGRSDIDLQLLWGVQNLGFGNHAIIRERQAEQRQSLIEMFRVQDNVAAEIARAHALLEAAAKRVGEAETGVKQAQISYAGNIRGLGETTRFGDLLVLVNRPQEVVAALQQLSTAYDNYFIAINEFNRAQFRLYRALGYPSGILIYEQALGKVQPVNASRPPLMAPVRAGMPNCR